MPSTTSSNGDTFLLTREQARTMAAGLYQLSACDGANSDGAGSERTLILSFLEDAGYPELTGDLATLQFDPATAFQVLNTSWLRKVFLQAAVMIVRADGKVSDEERETLGWIAAAFGVHGGVDALLASTAQDSF